MLQISFLGIAIVIIMLFLYWWFETPKQKDVEDMIHKINND